MMTEHERIWLEPEGAPDRCWCQDNQWGDEGVEYVLAATLESLQRENEALKQDRYDLAYAITGGEDAPGLLDSTPTSEIVEIAQHAHRSHSADIDRAEAAEAQVKRMREALTNIAGNGDATGCNPQIMANTAVKALASTGGEHHAE